eukprot:GFUD01003483.1.p1 GENE.GFUD01003483.1~~GFUD01003483.1.p1  ORF type:complete len:161 (-),score=47.27 GFUD01003483.1:123-605(-)
MTTTFYSQESDVKCIKISDEILDGIFPAEEIGEEKSLPRENALREKFIIDLYGRPQLICNSGDSKNEDDSSEIEDVSDDDSSFLREQMEISLKHFPTFSQSVSFLLPYTTFHISILFIVILSILSWIIPNINSVISTIIIVISLVRLDLKYKWGITLCDG